MKASRSPRYPVIGLKTALEKVHIVYKNDYQNKIPKDLVAKHIGYSGLNGNSLGVISAISKFGLLDGGADQMWVTDRALAIIAHDKGAPERVTAILAAAREPEIFAELDEAFPGKVSDGAIRSYLLTKRKFLPDAADKAIRAYRDTREVVESETDGYNRTEQTSEAVVQSLVDTLKPPSALASGCAQEDSGKENVTETSPSGIRREVFGLDEGDVVLTFPESLSAASFEDLEGYFELFLKKARRRAGVATKSSEN